MKVTYCRECNHIYYSNRVGHYCRKCGALLVEAGGSFSEISEMNINERYKLAYELSNGRVSDK